MFSRPDPQSIQKAVDTLVEDGEEVVWVMGGYAKKPNLFTALRPADRVIVGTTRSIFLFRAERNGEPEDLIERFPRGTPLQPFSGLWGPVLLGEHSVWMHMKANAMLKKINDGETS